MCNRQIKTMAYKDRLSQARKGEKEDDEKGRRERKKLFHIFIALHTHIVLPFCHASKTELFKKGNEVVPLSFYAEYSCSFLELAVWRKELIFHTFCSKAEVLVLHSLTHFSQGAPS